MDRNKHLYDEHDLHARIPHELEHDPLYKILKDRPDQYEELFRSEFIDQVDLSTWYSTTQAGQILADPETKKAVPASSLKHYIDNMFEYVMPEEAPNTRSIRLNYLSIIKLKMIWLLKKEFRLSGLQSEVGILGKTETPSKASVPENNQYSEDMQKIIQMNQFLLQQFFDEDEEGNYQMKQPVKQLLDSPNLLTSGEDIKEDLNQVKEDLKKERTKKEELEKKLEEFETSLNEYTEGKTADHETLEELKQKVNKALEDDEEEKNDILAREKQVNDQFTRYKARQMATEEWASRGALKNLFSNDTARKEFIEERTEEIYKELKEKDESN